MTPPDGKEKRREGVGRKDGKENNPSFLAGKFSF